MPGFVPRISFTDNEPLNDSLTRERAELWPAAHDTVAERWEPGRRDVLFLGGVDWRYLFASGLKELTDTPRINLVQHVRHAHEGTELQRYLEEPAIRICVSEEVADAVAATGRARGPVLTIPNGIDVAPFEPDRNGSPARFEARSSAVTIVGYKQPELARDLARRLDAEGVRIRGRSHADLPVLPGDRSRAQAVQPKVQGDRAAARSRGARDLELLPREEPGQGEQTPVAGVAARAMETAALPRCACLPVPDAGVRISPTGSLQPSVAQSFPVLRPRSGPGRPHPRPRGAARRRPAACLPIPGRARTGSDRPGGRQPGGPRRTDAPCRVLVAEAVLPGGVRADACNVSFGPHADRGRRPLPGILTADPR